MEGMPHMTLQDARLLSMNGFYHLGAGYGDEAYILAAIIISAAETLKYSSEDYPQQLQEAMRQLEAYALSKDEEIDAARSRFWNAYGGSFDDNEAISFYSLDLNRASIYKVYEIFERFDLHRLSPSFKNASLNQKITKARAEYAMAHPPKRKGFLERLFGL